MGRKIGVLMLLATLAGGANAQLGEIIGVIGGVLSAGKARQENEQAAARHEKQIQELERERQEQEAAIAARSAELQRKEEERTDALIDGKIEPVTAADLEVIYAAGDGWDIAARPLVKPDKDIYVVSGRVTSYDSDVVLVGKTLAGRNEFGGNYFTVRLSKKTKKDSDLFSRMRVNGPIALVGKYTMNVKYQTVAAGVKVMPVFEAVHIIIPNYIDSGSQ